MTIIAKPQPPKAPLTVAKEQVRKNRAKYTPRSSGVRISDRLDADTIKALNALKAA